MRENMGQLAVPVWVQIFHFNTSITGIMTHDS